MQESAMEILRMKTGKQAGWKTGDARGGEEYGQR